MTNRTYIVVDLDGTLTIDESHLPYPDRRLNENVAEAVDRASRNGLGVLVLTARGMRTHKNDRLKVETHVRPGVVEWLERHRVTHDEVQVAKPWCGPRGFYVDDRNLHLEEFVWRFTGPFSGRAIRIVTFGRPSADPRAAHVDLTRIERWLDVCCYHYADGVPDQVQDKRLAPGDGREPDWDLLVPLDRGRIIPHAWFGLHHPDLTEQPFTVAATSGFGPFAMVRPHVTNTMGPQAALTYALENA